MVREAQNTSSAESLLPAHLSERSAAEEQARNEDAFLSEEYLDAALEASFPASDPLPSGRV